MNMTSKHKTEVVLEKGALADWLRALAGGVESGELGTEAGPLNLEGYKDLKVSFKEDFGGKVRVKLSVKFPKAAGGGAAQAGPEAEAPEAPGESHGGLPKYKSLKKHMKQTFKAIGLALNAGQNPPGLEAQSFIADSKLMVSYSGKGDEFYGAYQEKLAAFETALAASDIDAMKGLYQELAQIKRDCHSRHA